MAFDACIAAQGASLGPPVSGPLAELDLTRSIPADVDLHSYDHILVATSGGKDCLAAILVLLEMGIPRDVIEMHHHLVDDPEEELMEWPNGASYVKQVGASLGIAVHLSWRVGGFAGEMDRVNAPTAPVRFETPEGVVRQVGGQSEKLGTRGLFPQMARSLSVRWCSSSAKAEVMAMVIRHQHRFDGKRILVVDGCRAEESPGRATYAVFEAHCTDARLSGRRHVDTLRPVHGWLEAEVWEMLRRWGVVPHLSYFLGWPRHSCLTCIFLSVCGWATVRHFFRKFFDRVARREARSGRTINRKGSIDQLADRGTPYQACFDHPELVAVALDKIYHPPVRCDPALWSLPAGAFGKDGGGPS
jgi:3'-phosphoadenosine 5'-phosphosulfate sulfotransferase (PAPS reductase)/FAD synthetase